MLVCNYMYHREIALLSIAAKILVKILLSGLNEHLDKTGLLSESQESKCGFRKTEEQ